MFLVFNREMTLFFSNPKGREGILLQQEEREEEEETASELPRGPCSWGVQQPGAHWALFSLPVPTRPPDAKNRLIGKDPYAGKG